MWPFGSSEQPKRRTGGIAQRWNQPGAKPEQGYARIGPAGSSQPASHKNVPKKPAAAYSYGASVRWIFCVFPVLLLLLVLMLFHGFSPEGGENAEEAGSEAMPLPPEGLSSWSDAKASDDPSLAADLGGGGSAGRVGDGGSGGDADLEGEAAAAGQQQHPRFGGSGGRSSDGGTDGADEDGEGAGGSAASGGGTSGGGRGSQAGSVHRAGEEYEGEPREAATNGEGDFGSAGAASTGTAEESRAATGDAAVPPSEPAEPAAQEAGTEASPTQPFQWWNPFSWLAVSASPSEGEEGATGAGAGSSGVEGSEAEEGEDPGRGEAGAGEDAGEAGAAGRQQGGGDGGLEEAEEGASEVVPQGRPGRAHRDFEDRAKGAGSGRGGDLLGWRQPGRGGEVEEDESEGGAGTGRDAQQRSWARSQNEASADDEREGSWRNRGRGGGAAGGRPVWSARGGGRVREGGGELEQEEGEDGEGAFSQEATRRKRQSRPLGLDVTGGDDGNGVDGAGGRERGPTRFGRRGEFLPDAEEGMEGGSAWRRRRGGRGEQDRGSDSSGLGVGSTTADADDEGGEEGGTRGGRAEGRAGGRKGVSGAFQRPSVSVDDVDVEAKSAEAEAERVGVQQSGEPDEEFGAEDRGDQAREAEEEKLAQIFYGARKAESMGMEDVQVEEEEQRADDDGQLPVEALRIPGSRLAGEQVAAFERELACVAREGRWAYNSSPRWVPWDLNPLAIPRQPNYRTCDILFASTANGVYGAKAERLRMLGPHGRRKWKVRRELLYEWRSSSPSCAFERFDRTAFCKAVRGRNVVVVGDAFSLDFHDALLNHLVTAATKAEAGVLGDAWANTTEGPCFEAGHLLCSDVWLDEGDEDEGEEEEGAAGQLGGRNRHGADEGFRRRRLFSANSSGATRSSRGRYAGFNLRVVLNPFLAPDTGRLTRFNNRWLRRLKRWKAGVLILTRTALFNDKGLMLQEVRDTLEAVREAYPHLLVLWRNSVGGHPRCSAFTRPLRRRPDPAKLAGIIPADWGRHAEMNAAVRPLLREYGVVYLDVDAATSLRPDGHHRRLDGSVDCRHYCMPGPVDHWVGLLFNALRLLDRHTGRGSGESGRHRLGAGGETPGDQGSASRSGRAEGMAAGDTVERGDSGRHSLPLDDHVPQKPLVPPLAPPQMLKKQEQEPKSQPQISRDDWEDVLEHGTATPGVPVPRAPPPRAPTQAPKKTHSPLGKKPAAQAPQGAPGGDDWNGEKQAHVVTNGKDSGAGGGKVTPSSSTPASPGCTNLSECVSGTKVRGAAAVAALSRDLDCWAREGRWAASPAPRWVAWSKIDNPHPEHPDYGSCDIMHEKLDHGLWGREADAVRDRKGSAEEWQVRPALKFLWKSGSDCPQFLGYNRNKFCSVVAKRNVVFVGDSTQLALHDVFLNHLKTIKTSKDVGDVGDAWEREGQPKCADVGHRVCSDVPTGGFEFRVVHNNLLSPDMPGGGVYNHKWLRYLKEWNISIIVLNKGLERRATDKYLSTLKVTLSKLRSVAPDVLLVWRNTWRGHSNCASASGPLESSGNMTSSRWDYVLEQNEAVRAVIREYGGVYLDIDAPLSLRPDGHLRRMDGTFDCYHYCIPGPLDYFMRLFYNMLVLLNAKEAEIGSL